MDEQRINVPFPLKGLSENYAFDEQEPGTTRDLQNVRAIDPVTGRTRGAQRSGMNRYLDDQFEPTTGADTRIQEIASVIVNNARVTYSNANTPQVEWERELPDIDEVNDLRVDEFGSLYAAGRRGVYKYNQDGTLLTSILVPEIVDDTGTGGNDPYVSCIALDAEGNLYVAVNSNVATQSWIYAFEKKSDGSYALSWTIDHGTFTHDLAIYRRADDVYDMYLLDATDSDTGSGNDSRSRFRVYRDVDVFTEPTEDLTARVEISQGTGFAINSRMAVRDDGVAYVTSMSFDVSFRAKLTKCNPNGGTPTTAVWDIVGDTSATGQPDGVSGLGMGVAVGPRNSAGQYTVYTYGRSDYATATAHVRRIVDLGATYDIAGTDAWEVTLAVEPADWWSGDLQNPRHYRARLATDVDGRLYLPYVGDGSPQDAEHVIIFDTDGTELNSFACTGADGGGRAVAVPATKPFYGDTGASGTGGLGTGGIKETELVYLGTRLESGGASLFAQRMVNVAQSGSGRTVKSLAMGGGTIQSFTKGGTFTSITGGDGALDPGAPYVSAVVSVAKLDSEKRKGRFRIYIADGRNYLKYDPVDDEVTPWVSSSEGVIPPRCNLMEVWQNRIVLANDPENPAAWHMSAINDPENWDNFPQNVNPAQAISGFNARAGDSPDIVTALLPWDDDLLIIGGDHTLTRMDGNPMLGGQLNLISDQTGMAFGRPWCKEPGGGVVFFMSNQCAVYALQRGGDLVRLTRDRVERRMQNAIDWSTHRVRLVWNYRDEGLHVFQVPYGGGGTVLKHWFWDRKNDAWFEDQFGGTTDTTKQPTAVYVLDGDAPTDRVMLVAGEDGRIRAWDEDSPNDDFAQSTSLGAGGGDDLTIDSYVSIGPIAPRESSLDTKFSNLRLWLARDQDGVNYDIFVDDEPDFSLDQAPVAGGSLGPGHNPAELIRFTGDVCYLRLRNANPTQRWAYEKATLGYAPGRRK